MKFALLVFLLLLTGCSLFQGKTDVEKLQEKIDRALEQYPIYVDAQYCVLVDKGGSIETECIADAVISQNKTDIVVNACNDENCTEMEYPIVLIPKKAGLALVDNSMVVRAATCDTMYEHQLLEKKRYEAVKSEDFESAFAFTVEKCRKKDELFTAMCIQCLALAKNDSSLCREITMKGMWSSPADECFMAVAQASGSTKSCDEIKDEELRGLCKSPQ
jgi:hypothetical protein